MEEFMDRLEKYQSQSGVKDFEWSYSSLLPLQEYFDLIETHLEVKNTHTRACKVSFHARQNTGV